MRDVIRLTQFLQRSILASKDDIGGERCREVGTAVAAPEDLVCGGVLEVVLACVSEC